MADLKSLTLSMAFLLYSYLLLVQLVSGFPEKGQFHTVEVSSLSSDASVCTRHSTHSTAAGSGKRPGSTMMEVFHPHGPCSRQATSSYTPPSEAEILSSDRSRVEYIRARRPFDVKVKPNTETNRINYKRSSNYDTSKATTVHPPIRPGDPSGLANYVVNISLGTLRQELTLVIDTSSDLMLTRCGEQGGVVFSPNASTSYSSIPCKNSSTLCSQLLPHPSCSKFINGTDTCEFSIAQRSSDGSSYVNGFLSMDGLNISTDDMFPDFLFGCAQHSEGYFRWVPGLLGLGRGPLSFVSQTQETYGGMFSYCFPATPTSTGFLTLGRSDINHYSNNNMMFTPLVAKSSSLYILQLTAISVGAFSINIGPSISQTIVDSSTDITYLPSAVYVPMRDEFRKQMANYTTAEPVENGFDTCFDNSGGQSSIKVPPVSFTFSDSVTVDLDPSGILYAFGTRLCFAFAQSDDGASIFGNTQQKTMEGEWLL